MKAQELIQNATAASERVLITGASGWFGRTATSLLAHTGANLMLLGSAPRVIHVDGASYDVDIWDESKIQNFSPTLVVDCAFLTREVYSASDPEPYWRVNLELMNNAYSLFELSSLRKFVGFSSGAAVLEQVHPYGFLKGAYERNLRTLAAIGDVDVSVGRAWSLSGAHVTKTNAFAFSDFIDQAVRTDKITIQAKSEVFRRYCSAEDFITACLLMPVGPNNFRLLDSGGELVELLELANLIQAELGFDGGITRNPIELSANVYHSDGVQWDAVCNSLGLTPDTLNEQIRAVAKKLA